MTDRDLIVKFLEKVRGRVRTNSRLGEIAKVVALAMLLPVGFKLLDFYFLFRGRTVTTFFILWLAGTLVWVASRLFRGGSPMADVAANVDRKANLNDQIKTAYWFIKNPRSSDWIDVQIQRAAKATGRLSLKSLYPRIIPRTSYLAAGLLFLLVALNFVPLSLNYNWVYLQAAPAFQLTEEERISLENALRLLEKARAAENEQVAEKIEELINDLEQGNISLEEAIKQLEELQNELEESDVEAGEMTNGIQQMAAILSKAKALQKAASPMGQGDLGEAAKQLRDLSQRLNSVTPPDLRDMAQRLLEASEKPRASLQELARAFENASSAIQKGDQAASKAGLERIASELEKVKLRIEEQELVAAAGEQLGDLVESLQDREQQEGEATAGEPGKQAENKGKGEENKSSEPGEGEAEESAGEPGEEGEGQQGGESGEAGQNPGGESADNGEGKGGNSFGGSTKSAPLEGEATSLEVQLQQEALKIEALEGGAEPDKKNEAAGEQERSKIDYRNAPSDLTPAQRDLLNQDRIPWESRQLIKNYFQAVKPKQTK